MAGFCWGGEIFVPGDYPTIQAAVNAAADGDTVTVADGVYRGEGNREINIDKNLTIRSAGGSGACIIDCEGTPEDSAAAFVMEDLPVGFL